MSWRKTNRFFMHDRFISLHRLGPVYSTRDRMIDDLPEGLLFEHRWNGRPMALGSLDDQVALSIENYWLMKRAIKEK